jgi:hypothetical protein
MQSLTFNLHSAGVLAPGITSLDALLEVVRRGSAPSDMAPLELKAPDRLPPNERRRASQAVRLTLSCIDQALDNFPLSPADLRTVFSTDEGTGEICPAILESLHQDRNVSPLHFTNSVHNAPPGYFSIARQNQRPATLASLGPESFAGGLLCAVTEALAKRSPVLFVVYDTAMPSPLNEVLPINEHSATAWIISDGIHYERLPTLARMHLLLEEQASPSPLPGWIGDGWRSNSSAPAIAALGLLASPPGNALRFGINGQTLTLSVDGRVER